MLDSLGPPRLITVVSRRRREHQILQRPVHQMQTIAKGWREFALHRFASVSWFSSHLSGLCEFTEGVSSGRVAHSRPLTIGTQRGDLYRQRRLPFGCGFVHRQFSHASRNTHYPGASHYRAIRDGRLPDDCRTWFFVLSPLEKEACKRLTKSVQRACARLSVQRIWLVRVVYSRSTSLSSARR